MATNLVERINTDCSSDYTLQTKRPGIYQVITPFTHLDGDPVEIFAEEAPEPGKIRLTDYGMALMRLSYASDPDDEFMAKNINSIVRQSRLEYENGMVFEDVCPEEFDRSVIDFVQCITRIMSLNILDRDMSRSAFPRMLNEFVFTKLKEFRPKKEFIPLASNPEYKVDYRLNIDDWKKPMFLFPVNTTLRAKDVHGTILFLQSRNVQHRSVIIFDDYDDVSQADHKKLMNVGDKEFASFNDFAEDGYTYFKREA